MNGPHTPVFSRNNRWTQVIERVGMQNAQDGKPAGRMIEQMGNATPLISAAKVARMSPRERARTDFVPEMEDPSIAMRASARAAALGITNDPVQDDDLPGDIGHVASDPTDAEIDAMLATARGQSLPGVAEAAGGAAAPGVQQAPAAAGRAVALPRGQAAPQVGLAGPRTMPNFANVEGFDLTRKVVVVDGMEFKLANDDVVAMKQYAIQVVLDNVTFQLAQALIQLGIPQEMAQATAEKMRETAAGATGGVSANERGGEAAKAVHKVSEGEATGRVLPGPSPTGHADIEVSGVHHEVQQVPPTTEGAETVQVDGQGSGGGTPLSSIAARPPDDTDYLFGDGGVTAT
jgi:hypothetical protein